MQKKESGYVVLTLDYIKTLNSRTAGEGEEIVETVILPDCEDDENDDDGIADAPPVPSHSEAFTALSTNLRWLEARDDCDSVPSRLARRLQ